MNYNYDKNADRFSGNADIYESARPAMPTFPIEIIKKYLGRNPRNVIDLGCGTGLSTSVWQDHAKKVIGVEPNDDMRAVAERKANDVISFIKAYSHDIPVSDNFADAVICSQSFHWMEPNSTLKEVGRILTDGGVFAAVDCDWPPVSDWRVEKAYDALFEKVSEIESTNPLIKESFTRYSKDDHLINIKNCGQFRYANEIVFSNVENCTSERLIALAMSQGGLQKILKTDDSLIKNDVDSFISVVDNVFGDKNFEIYFSYRMRIGKK